MNGEIFQVSKDQFLAMYNEGRKPEQAVSIAAGLSSDIIVGMFDDQPLVYIGFAPRSLLSSTAYVWMITTEDGENHPILLARYAKKFLETVQMKYEVLIGHCFNAKSQRWLKALGAEFTSETEFEFRRV
jgi:hypothetical protein